MEEAAKLPPEYKINGINTKYIFRKAANRSLPNEWADRTKKGFPVPIRKWLREDKYYGDVKSYLTSDTAAEYFDRSALDAGFSTITARSARTTGARYGRHIPSSYGISSFSENKKQ